MVQIVVDRSGPMFNGIASSAMTGFIEASERAVADRGYELVQNDLSQVLQNPTGHLQSQVNVRREADYSLINDGGIIYGPWIEGVGSRNKSTRFKGYFTYRRMSQKLQEEAGAIAERVLQPFIRRMN